MNLHSHTVVLALWCAQSLLQSIVATILWRRKLHKQFPAFFLFLVAEVISFAVLFPLWITSNQRFYFWPFCLSEAIGAVLGFKVIHEIFVDVFRPYHTLKDLGTLVFQWAGVVMLLVAAAFAFSGSLHENIFVHVLANLQRAIRVAQVGLILFLLLFSRFLGVSRKQASFGISLGFGLYAGVELMLLALYSGGFVAADHFNLINLLTYNFVIIIWLGYSLSRQAVRRPAVNHLQTERWEDGLEEIQHLVPADSLIPRFENMVERALSRNSDLEAAENQSTLDSLGTHLKANSAAAGSTTRL